jgi:hypothetical protein
MLMEISVEQMFVEQMSVEQMSVEQMSVEQIIVKRVSWFKSSLLLRINNKHTYKY